MLMIFLFFIILSLLFLNVGATFSQDNSSPSHEIRGEIFVSEIVVPVVVKSKKGFVLNLKKEDFVVEVDGRKVPISSFISYHWGVVDITFFVDVSGSMKGHRMESVRKFVSYIFANTLPGDRFSLVVFSNKLTAFLISSTADKKKILLALSKIEPYGKTGLHDALAWIPEISKNLFRKRKVVALFTDGNDNISYIQAEEARDIAKTSNLPIYVFDLKGWTSPVTNTNIYEKENSVEISKVLRKLAEVTGGKYYLVPVPEHAIKTARRFLTEIRSQYRLTFKAKGKEESTHRIKVYLKSKRLRKKCSLSYRSIYKGPPPVF